MQTGGSSELVFVRLITSVARGPTETPQCYLASRNGLNSKVHRRHSSEQAIRQKME